MSKSEILMLNIAGPSGLDKPETYSSDLCRRRDENILSLPCRKSATPCHKSFLLDLQEQIIRERSAYLDLSFHKQNAETSNQNMNDMLLHLRFES